ncbi:hypothetical protein GCM10016455_01360 [Aliiroseovarius zhejiangensis]|uniref:Uncharacterized protein n=1 Tax=Aliiroseovarius zhejiangensis TaxID=1632025 RepID=A0ABQ3IM03_9RHOB|nr:hypothetical protein GCM10016455_01360 [Aliiroseovarius zhejiangensis]
MDGPPARATPAIARPIRESPTLGKNIADPVQFPGIESATGVAMNVRHWHISIDKRRSACRGHQTMNKGTP